MKGKAKEKISVKVSNTINRNLWKELDLESTERHDFPMNRVASPY